MKIYIKSNLSAKRLVEQLEKKLNEHEPKNFQRYQVSRRGSAQFNVLDLQTGKSKMLYAEPQKVKDGYRNSYENWNSSYTVDENGNVYLGEEYIGVAKVRRKSSNRKHRNNFENSIVTFNGNEFHSQALETDKDVELFKSLLR